MYDLVHPVVMYEIDGEDIQRAKKGKVTIEYDMLYMF